MATEIPLTNPKQDNTPGERGVQVVQETMEKFLVSASVNAVYGEPIQHGEVLIIPAAEIISGMGFGLGYGGGPSQEGTALEGGGGGGGGGRVLARPVAVIIASSEGVRLEPVVDVTKVAMAALTAAGFIVGMMRRMTRPHKAFPKE